MSLEKNPEKLPNELPRRKWWLPLLIGLILLAAAVYAGRKLYGRLEPERLAKRARVLIDDKDYRGALITLSRALQINNNSESATRTMIDLMEKLDAPQAAEWHRRLSELNPSATSDAIAWAEFALKESKPQSAEQALSRITPDERAKPEYQLYSGLASIQTGNVGAAREFFREAARLDPKNDVIRYNLALIESQSKDEAERQAGENALTELSKSGRAQSFALRTLISNSLRTQKFEEALALSNQLIALPEVRFKDYLTNAEILRVLKRPEWSSSIDKAKHVAEDVPADAARMVNWFRLNGQLEEGLKWSEKLDPGVTDSPEVRSARGECLIVLKQWDRLLRLTKSESWGPLECHRLAFLARAQAETGDHLASTGSWTNAVRACYGDRGRLIHLAGTAASWGWKAQSREALWVAADAASPQWPLNLLYLGYLGEKNSAELLRVSRRMLVADPSDLKAKNNIAAFSLLLGQDFNEALSVTQELVKEKPEDPVFRSTYAFALLANGMPEESMEAMEQLKPEQRNDPGYALYFAMAYQANGYQEKAREFLAKVDRKKLLSEEEKLANRLVELLGGQG
jgi:tetratricopeptide (TPR) repeat protein